MPVVLIEVRKYYTSDEASRVISAVYSALQKAFMLANNVITIRLLTYSAEQFFIPDTNPVVYTKPDLFTLVSIDCFEGRSLETKRKLYALIVNNLALVGIPQDHIKILLRENKMENWGIRGGQAACDIDVGYKVEI